MTELDLADGVKSSDAGAGPVPRRARSSRAQNGLREESRVWPIVGQCVQRADWLGPL